MSDHPLKEYMRAHDENLESMALRVGTSAQSLSRICRGKQKPSVDMIKAIVAATAGEVTADDLVGAAPTKRIR